MKMNGVETLSYTHLYKEGYYLEPTNGFIMQIPNGALREQLEYDGSDLPDSRCV